MPRATFILPGATDSVHVDVDVGTSLMQAAISHGIDGIVAECGGAAMCATCHVYVGSEHLDRLPAMTDDEEEMLDCAAAPRESNSRLSCQLVMTPDLDGIVLQLPEAQT